jgi:HEPN domain-containing protein
MNDIREMFSEWILKADHDLGSAKLVFLHLPDYSDTIAFHCQQAAEKYIKAILFYHRINFQRSHDLVYLLDLLPRQINISEDMFSKAVTLNGFSVEVRYPDIKVEFSESELKDMISIAEEFRAFALSIIKKTL